MDKNNVLLKVEKLTKYYKCQNTGVFSSIIHKINDKHDVGIENISFSLYEGEILGITGKDHCGKSTLLKLISGLIGPTSGLIEYKGSPCFDEQLRQISEYVSKSNLKLDNKLTLMENIINNFSVGADRSKQVDKAEEFLEILKMKDYEFRELKKVPNEIKGVLTILLGLISTKPILCMDQPFMDLAGLYKNLYIYELKKLAVAGKSIIITSSSKSELTKICNRIIEI